MNIITIGRQFGSGGRELGKRLADLMGYDYYDREIISSIAEKCGMNAEYVEHSLENNSWRNYNFTFMHSFNVDSVMQTEKVRLLTEQRRVIEEIAEAGKNCIIVGRNADVLLENYSPFNIFVCADMQARIKRCQERAVSGENLTDKQMEQNIRRIDKNRAISREIISDKSWGDPSTYHLVVNTTGWEIKKLVPVVGNFINAWYER